MTRLDVYMRRSFLAVHGNPYFMRIVGPANAGGEEWAAHHGVIVKKSKMVFDDPRFSDPVRIYFVCQFGGIN